MSHVLRTNVADQIALFRAYDTDGTAKIDLNASTTGLTLSAFRTGLAAVSISSLSDKAADNTAHADGAIRRIAGNLYSIDLPDATTATYCPSVSVRGSYTGGEIEPIVHPMAGYDPSAVAVGANTTAPDNTAIEATEVKVETAISNLAELTGITAAAAAETLEIKSAIDLLAGQKIPTIHVSGTGSSPAFNALHDVRSLAASWTADRGDLVYSNLSGTVRATVGGPAKAWRDQVNGWLASQSIEAANVFFDLVDDKPGIVSDGSTNCAFDVESASQDLFRNRPYSYIFTAQKFAFSEVQNQHVLQFSTATAGTRRVDIAKGFTSNAVFNRGRRLDADTEITATAAQLNETARWSICFFGMEWANGKLLVSKNNGDISEANFPTSGNSGDTASSRRRINGVLGANRNNGVIGPLGEIVVCNPTTALSPSEIKNIIAGMMDKWGVV